MNKFIAVNAGSSSLKFKLYDMPSETMICSGMADRIGQVKGTFQLTIGQEKFSIDTPIANHQSGVSLLLKYLIEKKVIASFDEIKGVGHRVVQGGKYFFKSVIITPEVIEKIREYIPLAPLHNGPNLSGIEAFQAILPKVKNVAVFDTAFHQTMEAQDYLFPIPYELFEKYDLRRYGFHGTSHKFLMQEVYKNLTSIKNPRIITLHLGSGASLTAIKNGKVVATSMGLTPLGGIMMGTRTGDIDPSVLHFAAVKTGLSHEAVYEMFNKKSGFLGMSKLSSDSRDLEAAHLEGNAQVQLTNQLFVRRIADFIGQYVIRLGGVDVLVFSAGIGENSGFYRHLIFEEIKEALGIVEDETVNKATRGKVAIITKPNSRVVGMVIPTNEELMIVKDTYEIIKQ
ncbi:MAG: acetate/propionate family kinase [Bacilli bacterium]